MSPPSGCGTVDLGPGGPSPVTGDFGLHGRWIDVLPDGHVLMDYRARTYDPKRGRFLQRDPAGFVDGTNLYEGFGGNPLVNLDPYGLMTGDEDEDWIVRFLRSLFGGPTPSQERLAGSGAAPTRAVQTLRSLQPMIERTKPLAPAVDRGQAVVNALGGPEMAGLYAGVGVTVGTGAVFFVAADGSIALATAYGGAKAGAVMTALWGGAGIYGAYKSGQALFEGATGEEAFTGDPLKKFDRGFRFGSGLTGTASVLAAGPFAFGRGAQSTTPPPSRVAAAQTAPIGDISLEILNPFARPNARAAQIVLEAAVDEAAMTLKQKPGAAWRVLSRDEIQAANADPRVMRMMEGRAVERMTAQTIEFDPIANQMLLYTGRGPGADLVGVGGARGSIFEVTTFKQLGTKLSRPYYRLGNFNAVLYERIGLTRIP